MVYVSFGYQMLFSVFSYDVHIFIKTHMQIDRKTHFRTYHPEY